MMFIRAVPKKYTWWGGLKALPPIHSNCFWSKRSNP